MKTYSIQWTSPAAYGASCVSARNAREALAYIRRTIPGVIIDSFAIDD
jgi:hypothetical protein